MNNYCEYINKLVCEMDSVVKINQNEVARDNAMLRAGEVVPLADSNKKWLKKRQDDLNILKNIQKMVNYCHDEMFFCKICNELLPQSSIAHDSICVDCDNESYSDDFGGAPSKSAKQGLEGSLI